MKLGKLRKSRGLTQEELAKRVNVSRALIGQLECGDRRPYPSLKKRIAEALNIEEEKIFR